MCKHGLMLQPPMTSRVRLAPSAAIRLALIGANAFARAEGCAFADIGEGHVAEIIDGRSFRLTGGREIGLADIELTARDAKGDSALSHHIGDPDVTLQGEDDAPDCYGRQTAFVFFPPRKLWFRTCCWRRAKRWCRLTSRARTARGFLPPK